MARYAYTLRRREITNRAAGRQPIAVKAAPPPAVPETVTYASLLKADLVVEAEKRGLDTSGTKADLVARLESSDG